MPYKSLWSDGKYRQRKYDKTVLDSKLDRLFHKPIDDEMERLRAENANMRILLESQEKSMSAKA